MNAFHPELQRAARRIPRFSFTPWLAWLAKRVMRLIGTPKPPVIDGLMVEDVFVPGPADHPLVRVRVYRPQPAASARPALLWIHGGGFIIGQPEQDATHLIEIARELGMVIVAVEYRLSPEHPYPKPIEDCYAALSWLYNHAASLGVRPDRIAIGGNSAGAGLAAGLVLMAHDRREIPIAFQLLIYPMLDDRTTLRTDIDEKRLRLWSTKSNRFGWNSYLGRVAGGEGIPDYAAPARRQDLTGLPPAWIGVGTCDLFHDEDVSYALRLTAAGVPCTLKIVEGAFHGFEIAGVNTNVVREFRSSYLQAMREVLGSQ
jgi:acetyl esterase/lipase